MSRKGRLPYGSVRSGQGDKLGLPTLIVVFEFKLLKYIEILTCHLNTYGKEKPIEFYKIIMVQ